MTRTLTDYTFTHNTLEYTLHIYRDTTAKLINAAVIETTWQPGVPFPVWKNELLKSITGYVARNELRRALSAATVLRDVEKQLVWMVANTLEQGYSNRAKFDLEKNYPSIIQMSNDFNAEIEAARVRGIELQAKQETNEQQRPAAAAASAVQPNREGFRKKRTGGI